MDSPNLVVDCDSHVMEPPDLWERYLEPEYRDRAIKIVRDPADGLEELMKPSDYFRRNLWVVAEPEERTIGSVMELMGEERVLWGSDFPHIDSTLEAPKLIRDSVAALSPERQRKLLGGNSAGVFLF